jgi:hypothetical protein
VRLPPRFAHLVSAAIRKLERMCECRRRSCRISKRERKYANVLTQLQKNRQRERWDSSWMTGAFAENISSCWPRPSRRSRSYAMPFRQTRCLIPVSGYCEWQDTACGNQPSSLGASASIFGTFWFAIAFLIRWTGPHGRATTLRNGTAEALERAMQAARKGYANVFIVDWANNGKDHTPADFARLFLNSEK